MANRNLSPNELEIANELLSRLRSELRELAGDDEALLFAYRRKISKELSYNERGKPTYRRILKLKKMIEQSGKCAVRNEPLPEKYCVLDRLNALDGYTQTNTRLIHSHCDIQVQAERKYS